MTTAEFRDTMEKREIPFNVHNAMTGSVYVTIGGVKYRYADHEQPSHYQARDYVSVSSFEEIIEKTAHLEQEVKRAEFVSVYVSGNRYKGIEIEKKGEYFHNGFGLFVDMESAANNLYYQLFLK